MTCLNPDSPRENICKRLVALEGTPVAVPLWRPPSLASGMRWLRGCQMLEVPRGCVWLQGDNAAVSTDSRSFGPVPYALITGRVWMQVSALSHSYTLIVSYLLASPLIPSSHGFSSGLGSNT